jgi:glyoxylase-like metal-dependent hydrolase (beta-lactamase superfamily II)
MQASTVVINPPDGDMAAYLRHLHALLDEPLDWLAPGHGFLVAEPQALLRGLIAHRLRREAKVLAALRALAADGPAALEAVLSIVYDDVSPDLHGVAQRSLLAHLLKLQAEGLARPHGAAWSAVV